MIDAERRRLFELHAEICKALSNSKRLEIVYHLRDGEKSVDELSQLMEMAKSNLSQHLGVLRQRRLVQTRREGPSVYYRLSSPKVLDACDILGEVLLESLKQDQEFVSILKKVEVRPERRK